MVKMFVFKTFQLSFKLFYVRSNKKVSMSIKTIVKTIEVALSKLVLMFNVNQTKLMFVTSQVLPLIFLYLSHNNHLGTKSRCVLTLGHNVRTF